MHNNRLQHDPAISAPYSTTGPLDPARSPHGSGETSGALLVHPIAVLRAFCQLATGHHQALRSALS